MTFKQLKIGERFQFPRMPFSGMKEGVCTKISPHKYRYESDGMVCRVGTVKVDVIKLEG